MLFYFYVSDWLLDIFWGPEGCHVDLKIDEFSSDRRLNVSNAYFLFLSELSIKNRLLFFCDASDRLAHPVGLINFMHFRLQVRYSTNFLLQFQNCCIWIKDGLNFSRHRLILKFGLHFGNHTNISFDGYISSFNSEFNDFFVEVKIK